MISARHLFLLSGTAAVVTLVATPALAHTRSGSDDIGFDRLISLLLLAAAGVWYAFGLRRSHRRGQYGRGLRAVDAWVFAGALGLLTASLIWPLDAWAGQSFAGHMAQHLMLVLGAGPLLVAAHPLPALYAPLPARARTAAHRMTARLLLPAGRRTVIWATVTQGCVMSIWHLPSAYEAALHNEAWHAFEHLTLLASAAWFWQTIWRSMTSRTAAPVAVLCLVATIMHAGMLGGLLFFATRPLYATYAEVFGTAAALEDQQWAGLIMWVPASLAYIGMTLLLSYRFLAGLSASQGSIHASQRS